METRGLDTQIQRDSTGSSFVVIEQFCVLTVALQESIHVIKLHRAIHTMNDSF